MEISVIRIAHFNAAHRLFNPAWTDEENEQIFGACSRANYHGHNYKLEVKVSGVMNKDTGFLIDLKLLKELIDKEIIERFDHKNLNLDTEEFRSTIPTAENIAITIYDLIKSRMPDRYHLHIKLWETDRNIVEYPVVK